MYYAITYDEWEFESGAVEGYSLTLDKKEVADFPSYDLAASYLQGPSRNISNIRIRLATPYEIEEENEPR